MGGQPTLIEVVTALSDAVDRQIARTSGRTDLGEMAQLSSVECLQAVASREISDLFGGPTDKVQRALGALGTVRQFTVLARDFFARLTRRLFSYYLSRELPQNVGMNSQFRTIREHRDFEVALDNHCRETTKIIKEFSGEWFSKHTHEGGISEAKAGRFAHVAFKKIRDELRQRRDANARDVGRMWRTAATAERSSEYADARRKRVG